MGTTNAKLGINDLQTMFPDIAKEWDYEKNAPLTPEDVTFASGKKRWWLCSLGHSYESTVDHRTKMKSGCPICAGKKVLYGFNDLETQRYDIARQWHPTLNGNVTPRDITACSGRKAWWCCPFGHAYEAKVSDKYSHNSGCPVCAFQNRTSKPEQAVFYYVKKYFPDAVNSYKAKWLRKKEVDIYIPSIQFAIEFDGKGWHKSSDHDKEKSSLITEHEVRLCRIREEGCPPIEDGSYQISVPTNSMQRNPQALEKAICELILFFDENLSPDIDIQRDYFQIVGAYFARKEKRSLTSEFPEIAAEWHDDKNGNLKPENFTSKSSERVWWKCKKCGYEWDAFIYHRTTLNGRCPQCTGRYPIAGVNDLFTACPDIAAEWDIEKNTPLLPSQVTKGNDKKVWWKCSQGHSYQAVIKDRVNRKWGCPYCSGKKAYDGQTDLKTLLPQIAAEWHPAKNTIMANEVRPGSGRIVWWLCSLCGNEWKTRISDRTIKGSGCPVCALKRRTKRSN